MQLVIHLDESGQMSRRSQPIAVIGGFYYLIEDGKEYSLKNSDKKIKRVHKNIKKEMFGENKANWPLEVKGSELTPTTREYYFEAISNTDYKPTAIILRKNNLSYPDRFLSNENRCYNFLLKKYLDVLMRKKERMGYKVVRIRLILDQRSMKVESLNSLEEYLNIHFTFETRHDVAVTVEYRNSSACNKTQCADIICNTVYTNNHEIYSPTLSDTLKSTLRSDVYYYIFP